MINKNTIKKIENLKIELKPRAELLLIYLGLKPAIEFNVSGGNYNFPWKKVQNVPNKIIDDLVKTLDETDLSYKIAESYYGDVNRRNLLFEIPEIVLKQLSRKIIKKIRKASRQELPVYVAQDSKTLDKIFKAKPYKDHREYGRLMGYPETAIQAFLGKRKRLKRSAYEIDNSIPLVINMVLSKSHYQQELDVLREWSRALKTYAPNLDREIRNYYS